MEIVLAILALALATLVVFLAKENIDLRGKVDAYKEDLSQFKTVTASYLVTDSDYLDYPDKSKMNKAIRYKLMKQIAASISRELDHRPDITIHDLGHKVYSYKFIIKREK